MEIDSTSAWLVVTLSSIGHLSLLLIGNSFIFADPDVLDRTSSEDSSSLISNQGIYGAAFLFFRVIFLFIAAFLLLKGFESPVFGNDFFTILVFIAYIWISNLLVDTILIFKGNVIAIKSLSISKFIFKFFNFIVNLNRHILKFFF